MDYIKGKLKKYFILLASFHIGIAFLIDIIMEFNPDLLTFEMSSKVTTWYSDDILVYALTLLTNIIFVVLIKRDLNEKGIKSNPILFITFCSNIHGVILFLLTVFVNDFKKLKLNDTNS